MTMTQKQNISDQDNQDKTQKKHFLLCRYGNGLALRTIIDTKHSQILKENTR